MFLDRKQTSFSAIAGRGAKNTLNEFIAQTEVTLAERLIKSGHPAVQLNVQNRMHKELFAAPNELHYDCQIMTDAKRMEPLDMKYCGITRTIRGLDKNVKLNEAQQRMLYVEVVNAPVMRSMGDNSKANPGYVALVVQKILPVLREAFDEATFAECSVITPYKRHVELYKAAFYALRKQGWSVAHLPQLYTVDGFQGRESNLTVVDLTNHDRAGFMSNAKRACVAFTRAREVQIIVGGAFDGGRPPIPQTKWVRDVNDKDKPCEIKLHGPVAFYRLHYKLVLAWQQMYAPDVGEQVIPSDLYIPGRNNIE